MRLLLEPFGGDGDAVYDWVYYKEETIACHDPLVCSGSGPKGHILGGGYTLRRTSCQQWRLQVLASPAWAKHPAYRIRIQNYDCEELEKR